MNTELAIFIPLMDHSLLASAINLLKPSEAYKNRKGDEGATLVEDPRSIEKLEGEPFIRRAKQAKGTKPMIHRST